MTQLDTSSLLYTVHVVASLTPIERPAALRKLHRLEFRLGVALMENILKQLEVTNILFLCVMIKGIPETGLGIHVIQSLFLHHKSSVMVFHFCQRAIKLVPMDSGQDRHVGCKFNLRQVKI